MYLLADVRLSASNCTPESDWAIMFHDPDMNSTIDSFTVYTSTQWHEAGLDAPENWIE